MVTTFAKKRAVSFFAAVLTMLAVAAPSLRAQWKEIALNVTLPPSQHVGALRFRDGVAWAGTTSLFVSTDTGVTWNLVPSFQINSGISDIAIYDSHNILVSTFAENQFGSGSGGGLFLTTDGGQTWKNFFPGTNFSQVAFNGSSSVLHAVESDASIFVTSLDGGATWNQANTTQSSTIGSLCFGIAQDKTIYAQSYNLGQREQGWVNTSTDLGQTWSGNSNLTDGDCETLAVDSCNNLRLYFVNENVAQNAQTGNYQSKIDLTNNAGTTWQTTSSYNADFYSGSLASTANVLYVGTVQGAGKGIGVERSTDFGGTWQNIGGPMEYYDTRTLAAVNNNIVLALDENGSIWRTVNKGGDASLFVADTISCDSITRSVAFIGNGCPPQSPPTISIIGANAASFKVTKVSNDSVSVTLYGVTDGEQHAELVISLDNGSSDTILLAGYVENFCHCTQFCNR